MLLLFWGFYHEVKETLSAGMLCIVCNKHGKTERIKLKTTQNAFCAFMWATFSTTP